MIASDASFSYTNEHMTEDRFKLKIMKSKEQDDELGIFGAEKYFEGVIDEQLLRTSNNDIHCGSNRPQEKLEEPCPIPKLRTPSSVRSESSSNSRRDKMVSNGPSGDNHSKKTSFKSLLASLGCNCSDKGSVTIAESIQAVKGGASDQKTKLLSSKRADERVNIKREDCFTFPVLNPSKADVKRPELPEAKHEPEEEKCIISERKVMMLNWGGVTARTEILDSSRNENDRGSDGSSDLFEIESFSTNENNLFLAQQATEHNVYAPSEASIDWSIVTASVADCSTPKDLEISRNVKSSGILSGCTNLKAVRIAGNDHCMASGDEKAPVAVSPAKREWRNQLDSATPVAKIQADTICMGSGLQISQNGFCVAHPVHRRQSAHASSHQLYMKH